jgi:hypothetical protein
MREDGDGMCGRGYKKGRKLGEEGSDLWIGLTGRPRRLGLV